MLVSVNEGFHKGRITKQDLVSWIILCFQKKDLDRTVPKIRADHEDPILVLEAKLAELKAARRTARQS